MDATRLQLRQRSFSGGETQRTSDRQCPDDIGHYAESVMRILRRRSETGEESFLW